VRNAYQTTLVTSSGWIEGLHLDQSARARVRFHPASAQEGIVFVRSDQPGEPQVQCVPDNLRSMPRWTSLEAGGVWVHHTEHVLAAIALSGLDNVRVEMDADRVPVTGGGTCAEFVVALKSAGLAAQHARRRVYALTKPVFLLDPANTQGEESAVPPLKDGRYVLGLPADRFSVSTVFHWAHLPSLPVGVAEYEADRNDADPAILQARSYLVETELEQVRPLLGPVQDQVMMLYPDCPPEMAHEAARHKIVDFIGDMMILGRPLIGRFVAFRAGHRIHHALVQQMIKEKSLILTEMT
jgi:UDP-3-O-acyl-N-acetylglucosamine deacetylase